MNRKTMSPTLDGLYASTVVPMREDESIDFQALARHQHAVAAAPGMRGLLINGHAGENFTLDPEEKAQVVSCAREATDPDTVLISGVYAESSAQAADEAWRAQSAGADALLIFPPFSWALGVGKDVVLAHHRAIIARVSIPIMLYQASVNAGNMAYSPDILQALLALDGVAAVKEGSWETARYESNYRLAQACAPEVRMMPSGDEHLLSTFLVGGRGSQVSIAALVPDTVVALWEAVRRGDLAGARQAHATLYPLVRAIYGAAPGTRATARLKTCLHLLGRIPHPAMRAPMTVSDHAEHHMLCAALREAGLL